MRRLRQLKILVNLEDEDSPLSAIQMMEVQMNWIMIMIIDDDGNGTPGTMDNPDDEDDYDPAEVNVYQISNEFAIGDPCQCNGDQSYNGSGDGTFTETVSISVTSATDIWTINNVTSFNGAGVQPTNTSIGTALTFSPSENRHTVVFNHSDNDGFVMTVEGPFEFGNPNNIVLTKSNLCEYPVLTDPVVIDYCNLTSTIDLSTLVSEQNLNPGNVSVTIDGQPVTTLSPGDLEIGVHTVEWIFNGDFVDNINGTDIDAAYPGCQTRVSALLFGGAGSIVCNNHINLSLGTDCMAEITPQIMLEGEVYDGFGFEVIVTDENGNVIPDGIVTEDHIGMLLEVSIVDPCSDNSCWGTILVEDKLLPTAIVCPADITVTCVEPVPGATPWLVTGTDNCGNLPTVSVLEVEGTTSDCGPSTLIRTYSIEGTTLSCVQTVTIVQLDPNTDLVKPISPVTLPCGSGTSPEEIEAYFEALNGPTTLDFKPQPGDICQLDVEENNDGTQYAYLHYYVNGCKINTNTADGKHAQRVDNNVCSIYTSYTDLVVPVGCDDNRKVIRTWTILDWCDVAAGPQTFVQIIEVLDNNDPVIDVDGDLDGGIASMEFSVNPWNCVADFALPTPTIVHDLCTTDVGYSISGPGIINGTAIFNVPVGGPYEYIYTATDCSGLSSADTVMVTVVDKTPPVPVATQNVIVNLTSNGTPGENNGIAKVYVGSINNGSYDGCSEVIVEIRRETEACGYIGNETFNQGTVPGDDPDPITSTTGDGDNGQFIKVCCADATGSLDTLANEDVISYGIVPVIMRVYDAAGNYNETWVNVRVEKKSTAALVCPADVTLDCDEDYINQDLLGTPTTYGLCGSLNWVRDTIALDACETLITYTYNLVNADNMKIGVQCKQKVTLDYSAYDPFDGDKDIKWPASFTAEVCTDTLGDYEPTWTKASPCDFLGYSVEVDTFFISESFESACFKEVRTYTVIDWCVYDDSDGQDGKWTDVQIIKYLDNEAPEMPVCVDPMFSVGAGCVASGITLTNMATDNGDCSSKKLKWQILVDTWADGEYDWEFSSFIKKGITFGPNLDDDYNGNHYPDMHIDATNSGDEVSITIPETMGASNFNHRVVWRVTDGCGNVTSCESTFMVVDKKPPTPYCVSLSSALMADPDGDWTTRTNG